MNMSDELQHLRFRDAPVVTSPPFLVLHYVDRYTNSFNVLWVRHMWTDGNELQAC